MAAPTFVASGTATSNATDQVLPDWPAGLAAGDYVLLSVAQKRADRSVTTPSGFTLLGTATGGAGTEGTADEGTVKHWLYGYEAVGGESGTITVNSTGGTASCMFARTHAFRKTGGTTWDVSAVATGSDNAAGTAFSVTFGTDPGITTDDLVTVSWSINSDAYTVSTHTFTEGSLTVGTVSSRGNAAVTAGASLRSGLVTAPITAGTAGGAATYGHTSSGSATNAPAGCAILVRLREDAGGGGGSVVSLEPALSGGFHTLSGGLVL